MTVELVLEEILYTWRTESRGKDRRGPGIIYYHHPPPLLEATTFIYLFLPSSPYLL
jgi:hypothetical protein